MLGVGDPEGRGWVGRACAKACTHGVDLTVYNLGIRRDTSADVLARFRREALARFPAETGHRLAFSFGANDCATSPGGPKPRIALPALLANTETLLREAGALAPTLMLGPLPISDDAEADARIAVASEALGELCVHLAIPYLALFPLAKASQEFGEDARAGDGTHPGARGYAHIADAVAGWEPFRRWLG